MHIPNGPPDRLGERGDAFGPRSEHRIDEFGPLRREHAKQLLDGREAQALFARERVGLVVSS